MSATEVFSGSAVVGQQEFSLSLNAIGIGVQSTPGVYQVLLDCSGMLDGDEFELRIYDMVVQSGPQRSCSTMRLVGSQAEPGCFTPALQLQWGWDYTLRRLSGDDRVFSWSVRKAG